MDRSPGDRTVSFRPHLASPPPSSNNNNVSHSNNNNMSISMSINNNSTSNNNNNDNPYVSARAAAAASMGPVAPGYAQLSPSTGSLRVRRVASHRRLQGSPGPGNHSASTTTTAFHTGTNGSGTGGRSDNSFDAPIGTSPQLASLLQRRAEDPLVSLVHHHHHSMDSMVDIASTASPFTQSPVGAFPSGAFPTTMSRDSVMMQELLALQQQQQANQQKGVTVIYPQGASPSDPHMRMPDYSSMQEVQSNEEDNANEDRVQVRVEGFYEGANVNVLIPNDLPPSTLLYVLTASDGRDLMFKLTQYSLQLIICFLKMPSLFSPEVQVFTGPWAERLYRNYNTIRHGRSLFKIGRGLLNFFTVQTVCERMWMKYEGAIARHTCAVLLPVVTRVEKVLLMLGASPVWGRAMSRMLLHRSQAAELTPGQRQLEESQNSMAMDWRIQERMKDRKAAAYPRALLADDTFMHIAEVERGGNNSGTGFVGANASGSGGATAAAALHQKQQGTAANGGVFHGLANGSFTDRAIHRAMNVMGFAAAGGAARHIGAAQLPSQPVLPHNSAEENTSSQEHSTKVSPHTKRESFLVDAEAADEGAVDAHSKDKTDSSTAGEAEADYASDRKASADTAAAGEASSNSDDTTGAAALAKNAKGEVDKKKDTESNNKDNNNAPPKRGKTSAPSSSLAVTKTIETSTSSSADDDAAPKGHPQTPPFVHGTMPLLMEHDHLHGMTPSTYTAGNAGATNTTLNSNPNLNQPTLDTYDGGLGDGNSSGSGGRMTLLRPLPQTTRTSSVTDNENSMTGDEAFGMRLDSTLHEDTSSMLTVAAANSSRGPMSMPDNWRPAMAPTVPPSQSDEFGMNGTISFADHFGSPLPPLTAVPRSGSNASPPPPIAPPGKAEKAGFSGGNGRAKAASPYGPLASSSEGDTVAGTSSMLAAARGPSGTTATTNTTTTNTTGASASASSSSNVNGHGLSNAFITSAAAAEKADKAQTSKKGKNGCPPFEMMPAMPVAAFADASLPASTSASSSLSAMPKHGAAGANVEADGGRAGELDESEMSILSSEANSSFHVRPSGISGAMTTWMNELQPAAAALPARLRKGVLQFNPVLMTLLGIRNLAAGLRRFLRDACLISTERFTTLNFIEAHRRSITRFINRCWLIISIIDLILNTVRLLEPGWGKYATARQNIRCRCGCQGDEDPADSVFRTHGFIARRKTDLFFPPLNLDYGAPFVSCISYMEAADPARLMPACSRCGCLYKELPSEAALLAGEEDVPATPVATPGGTVSLSAAAVPSLNRSTPAHGSLPSETPFVLPLSRSVGAGSGGLNGNATTMSEGDGERTLPIEREKPRWVQMYEAEVQEAEEARRRQAAALGNNNGGRLVRRETQKPGSGTKNGNNELADFPPPPPLAGSSGAAGTGTSAGATGRPLKSMLSRDTNDLNNNNNALADTQGSTGSGRNTAGILFVPWMMRKFFDYVWLLRVHPNLTATILLEARYLAEFYLSYKYCFGNYETYSGDAPLSAILHPYGAIAGIVSAAVGLLRVVESAPTS